MDAPFLSTADFERSMDIIRASPLGVRRTPTILGADTTEKAAGGYILDSTKDDGFPPLPSNLKVYLKLENLQNTGSFKLRGITTQIESQRIACQEKKLRLEEQDLVTMSAGNYGRSFAYASQKLGLKGTVLMPDTAPINRSEVIQKYGMAVERMKPNLLMDGVKRHTNSGAIFMHSFDDRDLISGHGTLGLEILEDVPEVDIVLVCCGGGGLVAGVAAAVKAKKKEVKVYAVEPELSNGMYKSLELGHAAQVPGGRSLASGLSPPFAGEIGYTYVKEFCEGVILVSEDDLRACVKMAFNRGLVVEPAGVAAMAAVVSGKLWRYGPESSGKKVVAVLTGGNVSSTELTEIFSD